MKRLIWLFLIIVVTGCSGGSDPVECWIVAPVEGDVVSETAEVRIGFSGPVQHFELLVDGEVAVQADEDAGAEGVATLSWDTSEIADGNVELTIRVEGPDSEHQGEPFDVIVDNTAPTASLDIEHLAVLEGQVDVPVTVEEENIAAVRLMIGDTEVASVTTLDGDFPWDTTTTASGLHSIRLVVEDAAGRTVETSEEQVILINNGYHLTDEDLNYDPGPWVVAAEHTRIEAFMGISGTDPDNIIRVIMWLTWDGSLGWNLDYAMGQGFCPHRGIQYHHEESDTGELLMDVTWSELESVFRNAGSAQDPDHSADSPVFPYNGDPATRGNIFGHINVLEAGSGTSLDFTANFVFIYGDE